MSNGAQIGGIIGAAVGAWITQSPQGAQLGYTIGSTDGGSAHPAELKTPAFAQRPAMPIPRLEECA